MSRRSSRRASRLLAGVVEKKEKKKRWRTTVLTRSRNHLQGSTLRPSPFFLSSSVLARRNNRKRIRRCGSDIRDHELAAVSIPKALWENASRQDATKQSSAGRMEKIFSKFTSRDRDPAENSRLRGEGPPPSLRRAVLLFPSPFLVSFAKVLHNAFVDHRGDSTTNSYAFVRNLQCEIALVCTML